MNKKLVRGMALASCCVMLSLTGCDDDVVENPTPTESVTQVPTEAPTEKPTEAPTEKPTQAPTEKPTEAPTEKPTQAPTEKPTEAPTEKPTEAPTEKPTEAPTEKPTEAPTEKPTQAPTEKPTEAPTEKPTEAPTEKPTQKPAENPGGSIGAVIDELRAAGIVSANPDGVTAAVASGDNVEVEKVETFKDGFVVVTLNAKLEKVELSDISIEKYSDNWYALAPSTSDMTIEQSYVTVNDEGKTVIIYSVSDKIDGTQAVKDTSGTKFENLSEAVTIADNYMSWQMDHGGWDKGVDKQALAAWDGKEAKNKFSGWKSKDGKMLGTIDNEATYTQMRHIAAVYREVKDAKYQESVLKGLDFVFKLQYESGGFAQVYPRRGGYSDYVTFNDNAMINVLIMLEDIRDRAYPFDSDIIPDEYMEKVEDAIDKAVDYILKSQIKQNGVLTAWCAQHDPVTLEPRGGRAYELPSISGSESVSIIKFLMNQEQTPEIKLAVQSAIKWFENSALKDTKYVKKDPNGVYFVPSKGDTVWYRFYDLETNLPIFSDRDGVKKHNIMEIGEERRNGYSWGGPYAQSLLAVYNKYGYYAGRIEVKVVGTKSVTADNKKLKKDDVKAVETEILVTK